MARALAIGTAWMAAWLAACGGTGGATGRDLAPDPGPDDTAIVDPWADLPTDLEDGGPSQDLGFDLGQAEEGSPGDIPEADPEAGGTDSGESGLCGNGRVEPPGEACERYDTRPCTDFGWNFTGGNAWCRDDCTGWSFTTCITDGTAVCGNGKKESVAGWLEFCDTGANPCPPAAEDPTCYDGVKDCRDLGTGWTGGHSACSADCRTADVSGCATAIPAYGSLEGSFETPYVLNEAMLDISGYLSAHREALVQKPAFTGTYAGVRPIPAEAPATTVSYALRNARRTSSGWYDQIYVVQETAMETAEGPVFQGAQLELRFRDGPLEAGVDYPVNAGVMGANRLYLFHYTKADGSGTPDGSLRCLMAVGVGGRIRVTKVEGLYGDDGGPSPDGGGRLAFQAEGIVLYWLGETPYGRSLSEDFEKPGGVRGVEMCQKLP